MADQQVRALRGRRREAALRVIGEIEGRGCDAAGYRLAGGDLEHICCRHRYASDRILTVWPADDRAAVLLVGPHNRKTAGVYDQLMRALGAEVPADERTKPSCCDEEGSPLIDEQAAEATCDAVEQSARRRR